MKKTAKDLFKDLGFEHDCFVADAGVRDIYTNDKNGIKIIFYSENDSYYIKLDNENDFNVIDMKLHNAINTRLEEMEWC